MNKKKLFDGDVFSAMTTQAPKAIPPIEPPAAQPQAERPTTAAAVRRRAARAKKLKIARSAQGRTLGASAPFQRRRTAKVSTKLPNSRPRAWGFQLEKAQKLRSFFSKKRISLKRAGSFVSPARFSVDFQKNQPASCFLFFALVFRSRITR